MQRHGLRHFTAYLSTVVLYAFAVFIVYYSQTHQFVSSEEPKESVIKMSLSQFVPEIPTPPEPIIEKVEEPIPEEPVIEPEVVVEKEVVEEPTVIPEEVVPEPIVEKSVEKPIKKVVKKEPKPKKKVIKKKAVKKKTAKKKKHQKSSRQASSKQRQSSAAEKNKFWNALQRKIDKYKSYPRMAKKRGMEGVVKVKFTILRSGNVGSISVKGPKIFHNSARKAVKRAFPINVQKAPISLPETINVSLRYQIR